MNGWGREPLPHHNQGPPYPDEGPPYQDDRPPYHGEGPPFHDGVPYRGDRPPYHDERPYLENRPTYQGERPFFLDERHPYQDERPPFFDEQAPFPEERLPNHGERPPYSDERPPYHDERPPYHDEMPPYHGERPPYPDERPPYHDERLPFHGERPPYHNQGPPFIDDGFLNHNEGFPYHNEVPLPYQHRDGHIPLPPPEGYDFSDEESEDGTFLPPYTLEAALREVNLRLPRLAVVAPPSIQPNKGGGRSGLPNLGNTCYLNAVLQCLYHTPAFPARLALACEWEEEEGKEVAGVSGALTTLFSHMDYGRVKKGALAYFKGVCGQRDEDFAGTDQKKAYELLMGLLHWLHEDLAVEELECACTKNSPKKTPITFNNSSEHGRRPSPPPPDHHHPPAPDGYQFRRPRQVEQEHQPTHFNEHYLRSPNPLPVEDKFPSNGSDTTVDSRQNEIFLSDLIGRKCRKCEVEVQKRSLVSSAFEGIQQSNIICPKSGVILRSVNERFTTLSVSLTTRTELPLEEALQQHYQVRALWWKCGYCRKTHTCHQQVRILCAPKILAIHLIREGRDPAQCRILFPTEQMTLEEHMTPGKKGRGRKYSLYAICNHRGNPSSGHYTACCRANESHDKLDPKPRRAWYFFDDHVVKRIDRFKNMREAHILFYKAQEA